MNPGTTGDLFLRFQRPTVWYAAQSSQHAGEKIVDYSRYGEFHKRGTTEYTYIITDKDGLAKAVGEGIYPNTTSVERDPRYIKLQNSGKFPAYHWNHVNTKDFHPK